MQQFFTNNKTSNTNTAALTQGILDESKALFQLLNGVLQSRRLIDSLEPVDPKPGISHGE